MDGNEDCAQSASGTSVVPKHDTATIPPSQNVSLPGLETFRRKHLELPDEATEANLTTQVHFGMRPDVQDGEVYARYLFNIRRQEAKESFGNFLESLQTLSSCCNFDFQQDSLIRDRIVVGVSDGGLRGRLLQEPRLTLVRCVELCKQHDASVSSNATRSQPGEAGTGPQTSSSEEQPSQSSSDSRNPTAAEAEWLQDGILVTSGNDSGVTAVQKRTPNPSGRTGFSGLQGLSIVDSSPRSPPHSPPPSPAAAVSASSPPPSASPVQVTPQQNARASRRRAAQNLQKDLSEPALKQQRQSRERCRYRCHLCSRNFSDAGTLQSHLEVQHGKVESTPAESEDSHLYTCPCGKRYKDQSQLQSHRCRLKTAEKTTKAAPSTSSSKNHVSPQATSGRTRNSRKEPYVSVPKLELPEFSDDDSESFHVDIPDQNSPANEEQSEEEAVSFVNIKDKPLRKRWRASVKDNSDTQFARRCPHCNKGFTMADVQNQKFYAHRRGCRKVECGVCKAQVSEGYLPKHMVLLHKASDFKCSTCDGAFVSQAELKSHRISSGHPADKDSRDDSSLDHVCHICLRVFGSFPLLARHLQTFVHDKPADFACSVCGHSVTSRANLHIHMYRKHSKETKIDHKDFFTCNCGLGFVEEEKLSRHKLICKKPQRKSAEKKTILRNREETPVDSRREFTCQTCQEAFSVWADFDQHVSESGHVQEEFKGGSDADKKEEEGKKETYTCRLCQAKFHDKDDLTRHLLGEAHQGDLGSLQCAVCKKLFKTKQALQIHLKTHTEAGTRKTKSRSGTKKRPMALDSSDLNSSAVSRAKASRESMAADDSMGGSSTQEDGLFQDGQAEEGDEEGIVRRCPYCDMGFTTEDLRNQKYYAHKRGCKKVQCDVCSTTVSESYLARHMAMMHGVSEFRCKTCDTVFVNAIDLKSHWHSSGHQPTEGMGVEMESDHVCHICHKVFTSQAFLTRHLQSYVHEKPQVFRCSLCGTCISNRMNLHIHMYRKHGKEQGKDYKEFYTCLCGTGFIDKEELTAHKEQCKWKEGKKKKTRTRSESAEKDLQCDECSEEFPDRTSLESHVLETGHEQRRNEDGEDCDDEDSESVKGEYPCKLCKETFTTKRRLTRHMFGPAHQENPSNPQCHICQKVFKHKSYLREHLQTHSEDRPFVCEVCGKGFKKSTTLCNHRIIHTGARTCKCEFCGREFRQQAYLKKHRRLHTGERPYQCHLCGQRFHINSHLLHHVRLHSGERPYKCETCGKSFAKTSQLKGHKATHTDDRPWQCSTCGKAFKTQRQMKAHEFLHTGVKEYVCQACGMSFARTSNLSQHMHKYHPDLARALYPQKYRNLGAGSSSPQPLPPHIPPPPSFPPPPPLNDPTYPSSSLSLPMTSTLTSHEMTPQGLQLMNMHDSMGSPLQQPPQQLQLHPGMAPPPHFQPLLPPHSQYNMMG